MNSIDFVHSFRENVIANNTGNGLEIFDTGILITSHYNVKLQNNTVKNPSLQYEIYCRSPANQFSIDVTRNYWGVITDNEVVDRIYDYNDNGAYNVLDYFPFLLSSNYNDIGTNVPRKTIVGAGNKFIYLSQRKE